MLAGGGAKTATAPGSTPKVAGVSAMSSPSTLAGRGRRVRISNSVPRSVRTSDQAPWAPERKLFSMSASLRTVRISRL